MTERIESIKRQIADGTYETPYRVGVTVDRLMEELDPPVVDATPATVIGAGIIAFSVLAILGRVIWGLVR